MEIEQLYTAYLKARRGKRRGFDQIEFEKSLYSNLVRLCADLNDGIVPASGYTFIHKRQKPREVWACGMELKILQTILDDAIREHVEEVLTPNTFNNRKGKGTHAAINHVIDDIFTASEGYTKDCWVIKVDLKGYFPNINQDKAWQTMSRLITDRFTGAQRDLLLLIAERVNYCNPQFGAVRRSPMEQWTDEIPRYKSLFAKPFGRGAAIGFLYWQTMSNLYLNDIDRWVLQYMTPYYTRYVDDMVFVTTNKEVALSMLPLLREELRRMDVQMHPTKFYCQHYTKGLEFLGYHIKPNRVHLNRHILHRAVTLKRRDEERYKRQMTSYMGMIKASSDRVNINNINNIKYEYREKQQRVHD